MQGNLHISKNYFSATIQCDKFNNIIPFFNTFRMNRIKKYSRTRL